MLGHAMTTTPPHNPSSPPPPATAGSHHLQPPLQPPRAARGPYFLVSCVYYTILLPTASFFVIPRAQHQPARPGWLAPWGVAGPQTTA